MKQGPRKQVKIVRIIARLNIGGPAIHTILLSGSMNKNGYRDVLICGKPGKSEGDMMYLAAENNVVPVIIPELGRDISLMNDIKSYFKLLSIIKKEKPDIVHTHTAKAGTLGRLAAITGGVPVKIHTFHGHVFDGYFGPVKKTMFLLIERFLAIFTDRIVTVSEAVRNEIVDKYKIAKRDKSVVVPLGLDLDKFLRCEGLKGRFRRKLNIGDEVLLVGIVGRLVPIKNHKMFLDVVKNVLDKKISREIKFVVIGDGELRDSLEEHANRLGIRRSVIFTGWVTELAEAYADLDVVALTSLNEGTPVSLIEAMASAKPVIAVNVGGVCDIVQDGESGMLSKPDDAKDFSKKLFTMLEDKDIRTRHGKCGREFVRNRHNRQRLVNDIRKLYEECLGRRTV